MYIYIKKIDCFKYLFSNNAYLFEEIKKRTF